MERQEPHNTIERWLAYLKNVREFRPLSLVEYECAIRRFATELDPLSARNREDVRAAILRIKDKRNWSGASTHKNSKCIKSFYEWATSSDLLPYNPYPQNEFKKPRQKRPPFLTEEIYQKMISNPWTAHRDVVVMMILWDTGIRATELCTLEFEDIDLSKGLIHIPQHKSKGELSDRYIPIVPQTIAHLQKQIDSVRLNAPKSTYVFTTKYWTPMTYRDVDYLLDKAGSATLPAFPEKEIVNAHMFRHAFGVRMLALGCEQITVMYYLGHKDPGMTKHYMNATPDQAIQLDPRRRQPTLISA